MRARGQRRHHSAHSTESAPADLRHGGAGHLRARARTARRRRRRVPPDLGEHAIAARRTEVVRRWRPAGIGTARQEGVPTEAKGRTHAASAPIHDGSEARTAQSSGAHPRPETRASQPGRPRLVPAARTASRRWTSWPLSWGRCPCRRRCRPAPGRWWRSWLPDRTSTVPSTSWRRAVARPARCPAVRREPRRNPSSACGPAERRRRTSRPSDRPTASKRPHIAARGRMPHPVRRSGAMLRGLLDQAGSRLRPGGGRRALQEGGRGALGR